MLAEAKWKDAAWAAVLACAPAALTWYGQRDQFSWAFTVTFLTVALPAVMLIFFVALFLPGGGHVTMGGEVPLIPLVGLTWLFWSFLFLRLVVRRRARAEARRE